MSVVLTPQFGVLGSGSPRRLTHVGKFPLSLWALGDHSHQLALSTINQSPAFHTSSGDPKAQGKARPHGQAFAL